MKTLWALLIALLLCGTASAQVFDFPNTPTTNQIVTGPFNQQYKWDGTKWVQAPASSVALPVNNPTYTGTMNGANLTLSGTLIAPTIAGATNFTGTLTFPDASTYTTAGHNNMQGIGIGTVAPAQGSGFVTPMLAIGPLTMLANTYTSNAKTEVNNNFAYGAHSNGTNWIADAETTAFANFVGTGNAIGTGTESEYGIQFYNNQTVGSIFSTASRVQYMALRPTGLYLEHGGLVTLQPASAAGQHGGLTIGAGGPGADDIDITDTHNGATRIFINNASTGTGAQMGTFLQNDNGVLAGVALTGHGSTFGGLYPADEAYFNNSGPGGIMIAATASGTPSASVNISSGAEYVGRFFSDLNHVEGLALPGFAPAMGNGNTVAGLVIGNNYFTGYNYASLDISGAAYYNASTGQWVGDGGAGSGTWLLQGTGSIISLYSGPAVAGGATVTWTRQFAISSAGDFLTNLLNDTTAPAPTITNGSLMSGSRDGFGYILPTAWPVHLTWGRPFPGGINSGCIAIGGAGTSGLLYTNNQTNTGIDIGCVNYAGGPVCNPIWFQYVCFGVG